MIGRKNSSIFMKMMWYRWQYTLMEKLLPLDKELQQERQKWWIS